MSLLYDQPAAHHNPQRDPFPSESWAVHGGRVGAYTIADPALVRVRWGRV